MPVSIVDYENLIKDPLSLGYFKNLRRMNPIINLFPVTNVGSLVVSGQEWDTLPAMQWRDLNEQFTDDTGKTKPTEERLAILGGSFKADKLFKALNQQMYQDPEQAQFKFWNTAIDRGLTDYVFNGDIDTNAKAFNGLYKRLKTLSEFGASAVVDCDDGGSASHDVFTDAASAEVFFQHLDEAIYEAGLAGLMVDSVPRGALFMNKKTFLGIQRAAKMIDYSIDQIDYLGYWWKSYSGIPMVDVGLKGDKATEIIGNAYDPGDAGNDCSRIFVVRFATPDGDIDSPGADGLHLVEAQGYTVLGPEEYAEYVRWALQWVLGMCHIGDNYCASVLENFAMK